MIHSDMMHREQIMQTIEEMFEEHMKYQEEFLKEQEENMPGYNHLHVQPFLCPPGMPILAKRLAEMQAGGQGQGQGQVSYLF